MIIANRYSNNQNVWYLGYWGWQWYATEENLNQYDSLNSNLNIGDIVIQPQIPIQLLNIKDQERAVLIEKIKIPLNYGLIFRTMVRDGRSGFYSCYPGRCLPWNISLNSVEEFYIFKITK